MIPSNRRRKSVNYVLENGVYFLFMYGPERKFKFDWAGDLWAQ